MKKSKENIIKSIKYLSSGTIAVLTGLTKWRLKNYTLIELVPPVLPVFCGT